MKILQDKLRLKLSIRFCTDSSSALEHRGRGSRLRSGQASRRNPFGLQRLASVLLLILVVVLAMDGLSAWIRKRFLLTVQA